MDFEPDFRPFVAEDDGTHLVLRRTRTLSDLLLRACLYMLLLLSLALLALIPYAAWTRTHGWHELPKTIVGLVVLLPLTGFVVKLALWAFHLEGVQHVACGPDGVDLVARGALLRRREQVRGVVALEARTVRTPTKYRDVRWLQLYVRTADGKTELGYLHLHPEAEPSREAAVRAAAGRIAARLQVPLELYGEDGGRVDPDRPARPSAHESVL